MTQNTVYIFATVLLALGFWWIMRVLWPPALRRQHNELIGWQVTVLGTTYAVIIGFMLFAVWDSFERAEINAATEANCLVNAYRSAAGLPAPQRIRIQKLASDYADAMLNEEWPAMAHVSISPTATRITEQLWATVSQAEPQSVAERTSLDHTMTELTNMTEHRRVRQLQSETTLPGVLWAVLIVGEAITIMSCCLFGSDNLALHMTQIVALSLMLSLVLVAIADINRPFQGSVHVSPGGFVQARQTFRDYEAEAKRP
ncbi:MAG: DUF4239 domain-containing protein [Acidobacteriaceae bacterium]